MKTTRVAIYARVSTDQQTVENQLAELSKVAESRGWTVVKVFTDQGISGAKGRDKRPAFDALLKGATKREFDIVAAWSVDRLGRSLGHLVDFLAEIHGCGVDLYLHTQGVDTSTPAGKALFQMCGVFAEFERSMIQERVKSGLARAKKAGTRLGRPPIGGVMADKVRLLRAQGRGMTAISKELGVGSSTVQKILAA